MGNRICAPPDKLTDQVKLPGSRLPPDPLRKPGLKHSLTGPPAHFRAAPPGNDDQGAVRSGTGYHR